MSFRTALIGESDYLKTGLAELLRSSGFEVELCKPADAAAVFDRRPHAYDLIIVSTDMTAALEENKLFESLLDTHALLILDERGGTHGREQSFLIRPDMSPEDIMATINNLIFLGSNQRKSHRIKVNLPVEYECEGRRSRSTILDIGENGFFISTLAPPIAGTQVSIRFALPGRTKEITARGHVAYAIGCDLDRSIIPHPSSPDRKIVAMPGMGIVIDQMREENRTALRTFIEQRR